MTDLTLITKEFVVYLRSRHKLSDRSLAAYQDDIADFAGFFQKNAEKVPFEDGLKVAVRAYFQEQLKAGYRAGTIRRKMSAIHALCRFLIQHNRLAFDPFVFLGKLKLPLYEKKKPLTASDASKLRLGLNNEVAGFYARRNNILIDMLWTYRIKLQDVVNLNVADVDLLSGTLRLSGSGRSKLLALKECTTSKLRTYLTETENNGGAGDWDLPLFRNRYGARLSTTSVRKIVRSLAKSCGINSVLTPRLLQTGNNIEQLLRRGSRRL